MEASVEAEVAVLLLVREDGFLFRVPLGSRFAVPLMARFAPVAVLPEEPDSTLVSVSRPDSFADKLVSARIADSSGSGVDEVRGASVDMLEDSYGDRNECATGNVQVSRLI